MKWTKVIITILTILVITGCQQVDEKSKPAETKEKVVTQKQDIKQLIADYSMDKIEAESVSATWNKLIVTDGGLETLYDMPKDEFYVSIAPYFEKTHPCANHNLTGCMGELANEEFEVHIEDADGNVIVDKTLTSLSNGFIDFWLPREKTYKVTIKKDGKVAEKKISTFKEDNTCIADMQLK